MKDIFSEIADEALLPSQMPGSDASWPEINMFALTCDGYRRCGGFEQCAAIGNAVAAEYKQGAVLPRSLERLRIALFFEQRRWRHFGDVPEGNDLSYVKALVEAIRTMVTRGQ